VFQLGDEGGDGGEEEGFEDPFGGAGARGIGLGGGSAGGDVVGQGGWLR
jgi:hypothetical protein